MAKNNFNSILLFVLTTAPIATVYADSAKLINPNNGHAYQRFDTFLTWTEAKAACESKDAHLATITSQAENDYIVKNGLYQKAWLGATDFQTEGVWKWITGENWNYSNWYPGEPNNLGNEDYLSYVFTRGQWNDCSNNAEICPTYIGAYLCEWESVSTPSLNLSAISPNAIQLFWNKDLSAKSYRIQRKTGDCSSTSAWTTLIDLNPTITTFQNWELTANTAYSYRISNYYGSTSFSPYSTCAPATTALAGTPRAPGNLVAISSSNSQVDLRWHDNSGNETRFDVYRKTNAGSWTLIKTTVANVEEYSDLTASGNNTTTRYAYDVRACNTNGCSLANQLPVTVPFSPNNLTATVTTTTVKLSWTENSDHETALQVWRKNGDCGSANPWAVVKYGLAPNTTAFNDSNAVSGDVYAYKVRAVDRAIPNWTNSPLAISNFSGCVSATAP